MTTRKPATPDVASLAHEIPSSVLPAESIPAALLKLFEVSLNGKGWELAIDGFWSDSPYHSGHVAYYVLQHASGAWLLKSSERNAELDGVTEEDVESGALNDDQIQAMWGTTLEKAQQEIYEKIVAVWIKPPLLVTSTGAAKALYVFIAESGGKEVDEPGDDGLLVE
jgi:hypothetical protein